MVTPWLFLAVYYGTSLLNSQTRQMRAVDAHIVKISQQWDRFRAEHPGFDEVKLFAYTDGDGMFGAHGNVATDEQVSELHKFMESTVPPRPVYVDSVSRGRTRIFRVSEEVRTNRSREREPDDSLGDKFSVTGSWLPPLMLIVCQPHLLFALVGLCGA